MEMQTQDFIKYSQRAADAERETQLGLCCCEYVNKDKERFHILGCCCNCEHFDRVFTSIITCRSIDSHNRKGMLLTFQDRLRIPWQGGAKQISLEALLPVFVLPFVIGIAAINGYAAFIIFLTCSISIGYAYWHVRRHAVRARFFSMWMFWSVLYMIALFEFAVPLLELLPEENLILVLLGASAIFCLWRTKQRAQRNHVVQSLVAEDELPDITEASTAEEEEAAAQTTLLLEQDVNEVDAERHQPNICSSCHKYVPSRTVHCAVCGACILRSDHHSFWIDCCVGEWNHRYYFVGLLFAELALLLGANLTLTAICHPFLVVRFLGVPVMLPDDCSEVFDEYSLGLAFVVATYALIMAVYVFVALLRQIYLISRGTTMHENERGQCRNRKTCWANWHAFVFSNASQHVK